MQSLNRSERTQKGIMGWIFGIILAVLVIGLIGSMLYFGGMYMMGGTPYYYGRPFYGFFFFPFGLLFFILIGFFIFRLAFWPWRRGYYGHWQGWNDPNEILRRRYARGEINKEQYEQMKRDLEH